LPRPGRRTATPIGLAEAQFGRWLGSGARIVAIDYSDSRGIQPHNQFLLDHACFYFKSNLPTDRWLVFHRSGHPDMPATSFRSRGRNRRRVEKLCPISLGVSDLDGILNLPENPQKTVDCFVSLAVANSSTVRVEGLRQLGELAAQNITLDIADGRLSREEYLLRMSRAWLAWSPEGFGWDCHRHYEAPLVSTVPVINQPDIVRYKPLVDGAHCFYYYPDEPDGLARVIIGALANKDRLRHMAAVGRKHVLAHHTWPYRAAELMRIFLGQEPAPGRLTLD
jgi:hypothetical protein